MNLDEYFLTVTMEECGEVITECLDVQKRLSKLMRFGKDQVVFGQFKTNAERLREEVLDLRICLKVLEESGLLEKITESDVDTARQAKQHKIAEGLAKAVLNKTLRD